jgi:hypothetical protein
MSKPFLKIRLLVVCLVLSIAAHALPMVLTILFSSYHFGAPVNPPAAVQVDLLALEEPAAARAKPENSRKAAAPKLPQGASEEDEATDEDSPPARISEPPVLPAKPESPSSSEPKPARVVARPEPARPAAAVKPAGSAVPRPPSLKTAATGPATPVKRLRGSDFLSAQHEKLSYLISMHGIPIGNAELESNDENGATSITLRIKSNAAISNFFAVDDVVETRHIDGLFIMTTIRQQEGAFRSDEMFTINLAKKRVAWVDFLQNRSLNLTVPTEEVLDTLSGIYSLRNRRLEVGNTQTLHIYDSESYADVPVEILRREELYLPNLTKVPTLVLRPMQKTAGIFRRTGDVLIWMTDDANKVPVKIVTSVALGTVSVDLIAAESKPHEPGERSTVPPSVASSQSAVLPR